MTFTKDGRLYAALSNGGNIVEVNPATGAVIRVVATFSTSPLDLEVDPISGDLFVSGGGIYRITNFANGPGTVTAYSSLGPDGFVFAPDGIIYAAAGDGIFRVNGPNTPIPGAFTRIVFIDKPDGIALEPNPANPSKPFLYVNRNDGIITRIDTSALPANAISCNDAGAPCTNIFTNGSRGDFVAVGPSGCLYATQSDRVIKVTKADGTCSLTPTNPAPQIALTPENVQPSPAQGATATFTAQLKNVASPENIPVTLFVSGANPRAQLVRTDANGKAVFTYTGVSTGADQAFASADVGTSTIFSNESKVTWTPGKHSTFLTLNQSPSGGAPNKPLALKATLVDISAMPVVGVGGVAISFTLAGQTCNAMTDSTGTASCSITPNVAAGSYALTATFGGTSQFLSNSARKTVDLIEAVPPTVQFSQASYSVNEGTPRVAITVSRTGDTTGSGSASFATNDNAGLQDCNIKNGIASQRCDYIYSIIFNVTFAPGETTKSVFVGIVDDSYAEGPETFTVSLNGVSGASLGTQSTATVTIIDNDSTDGANPLNSNDFFIRQHYIDFLGREPDPPGFQGWLNILNNCQSGDTKCDRIEVSSGFFRSAEFQERGYFVYRFYSVALGRKPDYAEFMPDLAKVSGFLTDAEKEANKVAFVQEFMARQEFKTRYDSQVTATAYVDALLQIVGLPKHPTREAWITGLTNGSMTRSQVLRALVESAEVYQKFYNQAFVVMQYFGYLRRDPDSLYLKWIEIMNGNGGDYRSMVNGFMNSLEYRRRFGP
jgi:hypothetical protein